MASNLFLDSDSDQDSIKTDYTTQDDEDTLYDIEEILDHNKEKDEYLIKWAGYPLQEATWEPRDGLPEDGSEIWQQWEKEQKAVKQGKPPHFDREEYSRLWTKHRAYKNERRARRNAKRRKKNLSTRPDTIEQELEEAILAQASEEDGTEAEDDSDDEPIVSRKASSRSTAQQQTPRKGVAQKLQPARAKPRDNSPSSDESSESSADSSGDPPMDIPEARKRRKLSPTRPTRLAKERTKVKVSEKQVQPAAAPLARKEQPPSPSCPKSTEREPRESGQSRKSQLEHVQRVPKIPKQPQSGAARKSAPSSVAPIGQAPRAKKSGNIMSNWDADKQKRKRVPAAGSLSMDTGHAPRFYNLAMQNAVQKHTNREAAPDINALNVVDPKTGKIVQTSRVAVPAASAGRHTVTDPLSTVRAASISSAYARRSPPRDSRTREPVTTSSAGPAPATVAFDNVDLRQTSVATDLTVSSTTRREQRGVCRYWLKGTCRFSAQDCSDAHSNTIGDETNIAGAAAARLRIPPRGWSYNPSLLTCYFFRTSGNCTRGSTCRFAHHDTGFDAPPPKVTIEDVRASQAARARRLTSQAESASAAVAAQKTPAGNIAPMSRDPEVVRTTDDGRSLQPNKLTCRFWRTRGNCSKGDICDFAHWDTGLDAAPPGVFKKKSRAASGPAASFVAPNSNTVPLGDRRMTVQELPDELMFAEPSYSEPIKPLPVLTNVRRASIVMSPGELPASPVHGERNETTKSADADIPLWSSRAESTDFVTKSGILKLYHQGSERPYSVRVRLEVLGERAFSRLVGEDPVLQVKEAILSSDVQATLWDVLKHSPEAIAGSVRLDVADEHELSGLAEFCKLHSCGLLASVDGYNALILVYPSGGEGWSFLDAPSLPQSSGVALRMCVFNSSPDTRSHLRPMRALPGSIMGPSATTVGKDLAQLHPGLILPKGSEAVFLMIPPAHTIELEVYRQIFSGMKRKVYHSGKAGAWAHFRRKHLKSGVILVHSSVPLCQIPGLHDIASGGPAAFFMTGIERTSSTFESRGALSRCTRILAQGAAILLTDDLITYHPDDATKIIQNFLDAHIPKPVGGENNKIVARPGLKQFLMDKIERGRMDERYVRLYGAVCDLCPPEDQEEDSDNPSSAANLVSIEPELLPSLAGLWEQDEFASTDLVVDWFAGWAELKVTSFRRFVVCHQARDTSAGATDGESAKGDTRHDIDPRGWARKYQHIGVLSPSKLIEKFYKSMKPHQSVRRWVS
ncbi:Putative RNA-binding protein ZFP36 [Septoria linicola]|uniref:RNA-binding protein ZFP36 n=1 Tax=Septoria linicola TaxID=215465 RepID=A0A9Q9AN72_9PEZI|nr:Putative RNA-binding protein ZFP36 [Septoria linicola]